MQNRKLIFILMGLLFPLALVQGFEQPKFSTAGFYRLPDSGRDVYSMNVAWRFHKGDIEGGAYSVSFDRLAMGMCLLASRH